MNTGPIVLAAAVMASSPFPKWQKVTIEQIADPVPIVEYLPVELGSVQIPQNLEPLAERCRIEEEGRVVGYRFNC